MLCINTTDPDKKSLHLQIPDILKPQFLNELQM